MSGLDRLQEALGHTFANTGLLNQALTHRSFGASNNERLEFLGDALLGHIIAEELFSRFASMKEGELSRLRSRLVNGSTLAELASELGIGPLLKLGTGESRSGGRERESILADAIEAMVAAIYLDAGMDVSRQCCLRWFASRLASIDPKASHKDAKTRLQEWLQGRQLPLPEYRVIKVAGKDHQQQFVVECRVVCLNEPELGRGRSRRAAEQQAAEVTLKRLDRESISL